MMKIIKKIMFTVVLTLWSITASALELDTYTATTLKGPHGAIINSIKDLSKINGFNVIPRQAGSCGEAVEYFNTTKNPVGIVWSTNMYRRSAETKQNCIVNFADAKPIATTWITYDVCVRKDFVLESGKTYTLGTTKDGPAISIIENLNKNNKNIKFKNVTFEGSAQVLVGLVNKDVDVGYIATGNAASAINAKSIECLYSTGSTKYGQKPLKEFTGTDNNLMNEWRVGNLFLVRNLSIEQIDNLTYSLSKGWDLALNKEDLYDNRTIIDKEYLDKFIKLAKDVVDVR